jgi:hypothetical protein
MSATKLAEWPSRIAVAISGWTLALGAVGFVCGFFGPLVFAPDANQGPLLGIFITGPGGAALGALLGLIVRALDVPNGIATKALAGTAAVYALVCLYFCQPEPQFYATVLDAQIVSCSPPTLLKDKAFQEWEDRIHRVTWAPPRANWKEDFPHMLEVDPGVVLDLNVDSARRLYANRKPWNRGTFFARRVRTQEIPTQYFARYAGASCDRYPPGTHALLLATGETSQLWPAERLTVFLGLQIVEPLPQRFVEFASR